MGCADMILSQLDTTHDGRIRFDEFKSHFRKRKSPGQVRDESASIIVPTPAAVEAKCADINPSSEVDRLLDELDGAKVLTGGGLASPPVREVPQEVAEALFD